LNSILIYYAEYSCYMTLKKELFETRFIKITFLILNSFVSVFILYSS